MVVWCSTKPLRRDCAAPAIFPRGEMMSLISRYEAGTPRATNDRTAHASSAAYDCLKLSSLTAETGRYIAYVIVRPGSQTIVAPPLLRRVWAIPLRRAQTGRISFVADVCVPSSRTGSTPVH